MKLQDALVWKAALLLTLAAVAPGCGQQKLIPNTKIEDTPASREVLKTVESYRRAMEQRDAARVYMLADPSYGDDNGTPEPNDDLDYATLKRVLVERLRNTSRVRYRLEYQRLNQSGPKASLDVWIDATFVYEHPDSPPRYSRFTDYHRFDLLKTPKGWRFTGGL